MATLSTALNPGCWGLSYDRRSQGSLAQNIKSAPEPGSGAVGEPIRPKSSGLQENKDTTQKKRCKALLGEEEGGCWVSTLSPLKAHLQEEGVLPAVDSQGYQMQTL